MKILSCIKSTIVNMVGRLWLLLSCREGALLLVCPWGIGDCLFVSFFTQELSEVCGKPINVLCKKHTALIFEGKAEIDRVVSKTMIAKWVGYYCRTSGRICNNRFIYCHFKDPEDAFAGKYDSIVKNYYYDILHLKGDCSINYPTLNNCLDSQVQRKYTIDRKTVIMVPQANSGFAIRSLFWINLAEALRKRGYNVLTNVGSEKESAIPGTQAFCEPLDVLCAAATHSGAIISVRNGVCDLLACTNSKIIVLNTNNTLTKAKWTDAWDVNNFSLCSVDVFDYEEGSEGRIIDGVVSSIYKGLERLDKIDGHAYQLSNSKKKRDRARDE